MNNFLDHKLLPKVTTKAATVDGYEATNLISASPVVRSRGFLAYTSMKPPVDVDFELVCPINVYSVIVNSVIGTQKTVGVEIQMRGPRNEFTTVAHAHYETEGVIFSNARYYSKNDPPQRNGYHQGFFKSHLFRTFVNAKAVRVRILRTDRSIPCLGSVEIWGKISKACSRVTVETVNRLLCDDKPDVVKTLKRNERSPPDGFEVSDDFKDALTFEVMALPMTLPSGHTVDQSTLEKCTKNDAAYGRQGCDPFTGLPFSQNRKPKLNVALKNRIDMFLLQNSDKQETYNISRTVGRKRNCIDDNSTYSKTGNKNMKVEVKVSDITQTENKSSNSNYLKTNNTKVESLGASRSYSLEEAVTNVMNANGFMCFTRDTAEEEVSRKCASCKGDDNLYILPCRDLYCRACLLNCKDLTCGLCKKVFCKSDIQKFHA